MSTAAALARLNITLPPAPKPVASYLPFTRTGNLVYTSGQIAVKDGTILFSGPVGPGGGGLSLEQGIESAKLSTLNALAVLRDAAGGSLDNVARIVRVGVFVQSTPGFDGQSKVANGASNLLVAIFGESGKHARVAVGTNALPLNTTTEVELLAELKP